MKTITIEQIKRKNKIIKILKKIFIGPFIWIFKEFVKEPIGFTLFFSLIFTGIYYNSDKIYAYYESIQTNRDYQEVLNENKDEKIKEKRQKEIEENKKN